jgi:hypothetical protein
MRAASGSAREKFFSFRVKFLFVQNGLKILQQPAAPLFAGQIPPQHRSDRYYPNL